MSELDLLNLARSCAGNITSDFAQVITINFAMVVAIYYFLSQAKIGMKVFAFALYLVGMLMYFGVMLEETNLELWTIDALRSQPKPSLLVSRYLVLNDSWLGHATTLLINVALWALILGTIYLLFFWNKAAHTPKD